MSAELRLALLFSGQGSQRPEHLGWLRAHAAPELAAALGAALDALWLDPAPPPEHLHPNRCAQPLIFGLQVQQWALLQPDLPRPLVVAGYSLGEMAACSVAGLFPAVAGVELCVRRAQAMDACVSEPAGLLAVTGLGADAVDVITQACGLVVAIRNGAQQVVLGGREPALIAAQARALAAGAQRVQRLPVSVPSHTAQLLPASAAFAAVLASWTANHLRTRVVSGRDGRQLPTAEAAVAALAAQLSEPLDWAAALDAVAELQPHRVLELGPGNAMTRLWEARHPGIPARAFVDFRSLDGVRDWLRRPVG